MWIKKIIISVSIGKDNNFRDKNYVFKKNLEHLAQNFRIRLYGEKSHSDNLIDISLVV